MNPKKKLIWSVAIVSLTGLSGCVTTDTLEPDLNEPAGNQIVLNLAPDEIPTRASDHSGHKLRYVAKLYSGSANNVNTKVFIRQELIDGQPGNKGKTNQMVFEVDPGTTYTIFVFADYIPESATLSGDTYGDYYYDTNTYKDAVRMLSTPGKTNTDKFTSEFFNNDNYDCFAITHTFSKTEKNIVLNDKLKRMVSKVRYVDNSTNNGSYTIGVKKLGYYSDLDFVNYIAKSNSSFDSDPGFTEVEVSKSKTFNSADKEVVFFYTFTTKPETNRNESVYMTFTTTPSSGGKQTFTTKDIAVKRNFITTVNGAFLTEDTGYQGGNGGGEAETPPLDEDGPVYLNLGVETTEWNNQSSSWN